MLMIAIVIALVIGFISIVINLQLNASIEAQMGNAANDMAIAVAQMTQISEGLHANNKDGSVQTIVESIRVQTRYQYIIIMDMDGIQYAYPYESGLYKPYKNGGESRVLKFGEAYVSADTNKLISAVRSFQPIYYKGQQVGAVLVGLLTDEVQIENESYRKSMELALIVALLMGILISFFMAKNIKKSIFDLEPKEIALLLSEREIILQSIERGIVAIDHRGDVLL
jgi:two-component system CitB family sensor kinase